MAFPIRQLFEFTVLAQQESQAIVNVLHYAIRENVEKIPAATDEDLQGIADLLIEDWRDQVLSRQTNKMEVIQYKVATIVGRSPSPMTVIPWKLDYGAQIVVAGTGVPDTGTEEGAPKETFAAVGLRKVAEVPTRQYRGQLRIAGLLEGDTDPTQSNLLNTLAQQQYQALGNALIQTANTADVAPLRSLWQMVFARTTYLKVIAPNPTPFEFSSWVQAMVLNRYVTTQVSRKQRFRLN